MPVICPGATPASASLQFSAQHRRVHGSQVAAGIGRRVAGFFFCQHGEIVATIQAVKNVLRVGGAAHHDDLQWNFFGRTAGSVPGWALRK